MTTRDKAPIEALLDSLRRTGESPDQAELCYLSALSAEEATQLDKAWSDLPDGLRLDLISRLVSMAEADFALSFGAVFRIAMCDQDAEVRKVAIEGLWEDEDVRLIPLLVRCLDEDESVVVRAAAAQSLGRFILLSRIK